MPRDSLTGVDLFCGAGGTSTGMLLAAAELEQRVELTAINHWNIAIETHTANHPTVRHLCESLDNLDPRKVVVGKLDVLCGSPECTHHSIARGGRPMSDQSRASAWHIVRWAEAKQPSSIVVENVKEFRDWGPLRKDGRPMKRFKGRTYRAFLDSLRSLGYEVEDRILNAADYGDPTTRHRLFVLATRGRRPVWPTPSHDGQWIPARNIIDWSLKGASIFRRKRPLSRKTLARIHAGLRKYCGESFVIHVTHQGERKARSVSDPLPTITGARRGELALAQPFLVHLRGTSQSHVQSSAKSIDDPVPTLTSAGHLALCEPFVLGQQSGSTPRSVSKPLPTISTSGAISLVEPFLVTYYGTGHADSVDEPLPTVTARDRFGLVQPVLGDHVMEVDVLFRMLQPHELAAAMSFPAGYRFAGSKESVVRQIGNAVAVRTAKAIFRSVISNQ